MTANGTNTYLRKEVDNFGHNFEPMVTLNWPLYALCTKYKYGNSHRLLRFHDAMSHEPSAISHQAPGTRSQEVYHNHHHHHIEEPGEAGNLSISIEILYS